MDDSWSIAWVFNRGSSFVAGLRLHSQPPLLAVAIPLHQSVTVVPPSTSRVRHVRPLPPPFYGKQMGLCQVKCEESYHSWTEGHRSSLAGDTASLLWGNSDAIVWFQEPSKSIQMRSTMEQS